MKAQDIDLKKLERKVWTSFFEDGIWDIYLGLLLMALAVGAFFTDVGLTEQYSIFGHIGVVILAIFFLWLGKRLITLPRMGTVHFGPKGKARITKAQIILAISCFMGLAAFILVSSAISNVSARQQVMDFIFPSFWVTTMLVVFSFAAYFLNYRRLYIIGILYAITIPSDKIMRQFLHIDLTVLAFGIPALAILIMGFIVLARFLKKYPLLHEEEQNA
ncbi:MAG: hypothetical protein JSW02_09450 [candidate division WOR-3 bacterium]|nr:MAG: hypothetical protein JSW02_09450 [candidate division WOR-3 bacterium]